MSTIKLKPLSSQTSENQIQDSSLSAPTTACRDWLKVGDVMSEDIATIDSQSDVATAAKMMSENNISCLVVLDGGQLSGIVTEKDMLTKAVAWGDDFRDMAVEQIMSSPVRTVPVDLSIVEAGEIMEGEGIRRLVVQEDGHVVGIITQRDMVRVLTSYTLSDKVSQIMTNDVAVVSHSATVKEATEIMASRNISCLVVIMSDRVTGIFTERDLLKRVVATKQDPDETEIQEVMSCPVVTIPADCTVSNASKLLEKMKIRRLVVMDNEKLCGVITQTDILRAINGRLQKEELSYRGLLSESGYCFYTTDIDFNTTYINSEFMKLLEIHGPDEVVGKPFLPEQFWEDPHQRDRLLKQMDRTRAEINELTLQTASGRRLDVILFTMPIKNLTGEVSGSHGILYHITVEK